MIQHQTSALSWIKVSSDIRVYTPLTKLTVFRLHPIHPLQSNLTEH